MRSLALILVCSINFFVFSSKAQAEASADSSKRYETVVEGVSFNSASKIVLDQEAIRKSKAPNITSLLATQANISVSNSNLQPGSIFLRGGDSSHVLILVDGLPLYDPSTLQKTVSLNSIDIKSIRRIEIVKGSQSVLYGGQALTGVIKIDTLPLEIQNKAAGVFELGQYDYQKASLMGLKSLDETNAILGRLQNAYKNSRSPVLGSGQKYPQHLQSTEVAYIHQDQVQSFIKLLHINQVDDIATSAQGTFMAEDVKDLQAKNQTQGIMAGIKGKNGKVLMGYQNVNRSYKDYGTTNSKYGSDLLNVRAEATPVNEEQYQLQMGASYSREKFINRDFNIENSNAVSEAKGIFAKLAYQPQEAFELEGGLRADQVNHQNPFRTYQVGITLLKEFRLEYATGFKTPSLFQMYSTQYGGNPDLKSEQSRTYSASYEHFLGSRELNHVVSLALFDTSFDNLVQYTGTYPTGGYMNVDRSHTRGMEAGYSIRRPQIYRFDLNFGYQEPKDLSNNRWLVRRPLNTGSARLTLGPDSTQVGIETSWTGDRVDRFGPSEYGTLKGYFASNAFVTHQFDENFSGYIRGNNLENYRFESSRGYYDEGMFWLAGIEISN